MSSFIGVKERPNLTGGDIKAAYEAEPDTNAFTDSAKKIVADAAIVFPSDGALNDAPEFNSMLSDALAAGGDEVTVAAGNYKLDDTVVFTGSDLSLDFKKSTAIVNSAVGFDMGNVAGPTAGAVQIADCDLKGGRFELRSDNAVFAYVQNAYAPRFKDLNLRMYNAGQTGFVFKGKDAPQIGPYYGTMDNIRIFGSATPGHLQHGIRFFGTDGGLGSNGINRWILSNLRHIAAMDYGIDFVNAHGLVINGVNLEAMYTTALRFNARAADYTGSVTAVGGASSFSDSALVFDTDYNSASIKILTGPNAGRSANIAYVSGQLVVIRTNFEYDFTVGDTYQIFKSKARSVVVHGATCETAGTIADFQAGARSCRVQLDFATIASGSNYFVRAVEDMGNTIARRYDKFTFSGIVRAGGGEVWLEPDRLASNFGNANVVPSGAVTAAADGGGTGGLDPTKVWTAPLHTASNRGGVHLPETGFVDAVLVTGSTRNLGGPGEIKIETFANAANQGDGLSPKLTPRNPWRSSRVRKSLTNTGFVLEGQTLKVRAVGDANLAVDEAVRVEIYVGYL